mmetsp:Transcript_65910/g.148736  ORF Transcript_65910/g.148736 Transcript_65910/m.148736 type:complete len:142 (-) Transcript_65910:104-529(-)
MACSKRSSGALTLLALGLAATVLGGRAFVGAWSAGGGRTRCATGSSAAAPAAAVGPGSLRSRRHAAPRVRLGAGGFQVEESDLVQPDKEPDRTSYLLGFTYFAETFNGRAAMLGFFVLIFLEYFTNKNFLSMIGALLGNGS